jgi:hypothetical protein
VKPGRTLEHPSAQGARTEHSPADMSFVVFTLALANQMIRGAGGKLEHVE